MGDKRLDWMRSIEPQHRYWWQQVLVDQADEIERLRAHVEWLNANLQLETRPVRLPERDTQDAREADGSGNDIS